MVGCATSCDEGEHDGFPGMAKALVRQRGASRSLGWYGTTHPQTEPKWMPSSHLL